jgi:hypothetical protein
MEINKFKVSDGFPDCYASLQVDDDSFKVGQGHSLIGTFGIATCLAITLYSPKTKLGVLAHIGGFSWSPEPVGPKNIIDTMVKAMLQRERVLDDLEATLCGEAFGLMEKRLQLCEIHLKDMV